MATAGPLKTVQVRKTDDPKGKLEGLWDAALKIEDGGDSKATNSGAAASGEPSVEELQSLGENADGSDRTELEPDPTEDETPPAGSDTPDAEETERATDDEPATDEPAPESKRSRKLKINGKEREVTEDEAYAGFMMQEDYTRKTQAVAEREKELAAEREESRGQRAQYLDRLGKLDAALTALAPEEPDWEAERKRKSPQEYIALRDDWDRIVTKRKVIADERARVLEHEAKDVVERRKKVLADESAKLFQAVPEWGSDETKYTTDMKEIVGYLHQTLGFPLEQIAEVDDHRLILLARDALRGRRITEQPIKGTKVPPKVKPAAPGAKPSPGKPKDEKAVALQRLKESRGNRSENLRAGAKALEHFLDDK